MRHGGCRCRRRLRRPSPTPTTPTLKGGGRDPGAKWERGGNPLAPSLPGRDREVRAGGGRKSRGGPSGGDWLANPCSTTARWPYRYGIGVVTIPGGAEKGCVALRRYRRPPAAGTGRPHLLRYGHSGAIVPARSRRVPCITGGGKAWWWQRRRPRKPSPPSYNPYNPWHSQPELPIHIWVGSLANSVDP